MYDWGMMSKLRDGHLIKARKEVASSWLVSMQNHMSHCLYNFATPPSVTAGDFGQFLDQSASGVFQTLSSPVICFI